MAAALGVDTLGGKEVLDAERDAFQRPALPGGDPLAAALAAGEMPTDLPFARRESVAALSATYDSKAAALDAEVGTGHLVMLGFRPQWRGQTTGSFKMIFNALLR